MPVMHPVQDYAHALPGCNQRCYADEPGNERNDTPWAARVAEGDEKVCQEMISKGVNINARDKYDYTPLILVSLKDSAASTSR